MKRVAGGRGSEGDRPRRRAYVDRRRALVVRSRTIAAAATVEEQEQAPPSEPVRTLCGDCGARILIVRLGRRIVVADAYEHEPRARCYMCAGVESRVKECPKCRGSGSYREGTCKRCEGSGEVANKRANCHRCGGSGYVGSARPVGQMLAIDVAWGDEGHVRLIGPRTSRRKGEALYNVHSCNSVIMARPNTIRKVA